MPLPTRVMLLDQHKVFCECLASMLSGLDRFEIAGRADTLVGAVSRVRREQPDVLLLDLGLVEAESIDPVKAIAQECEAVKILILGANGADSTLVRCIEAGACGYILRQSTVGELVEAIELALKGETVCPPDLAFSIFSRLAELGRRWRQSERLEALNLTPREIEILQLIAEGLTNKTIAEKLCLSPYTVKNHVHHILEKLEVKRRSEAVEYACKRRWLRDRRSRWEHPV